MKRTTIAILLLGAALVVTNVGWAYRALDCGVTVAYQSDSLGMHERALAQALAILRASSPQAKREDIVVSAAAATGATEPFEKDGYLWVGDLGLRFSETGRLVDVVPAWSSTP
jgi:hypothetical protein